MRNPIVVLECLKKSKTTISNLYHNLYNPEFFKLAYINIYMRFTKNHVSYDENVKLEPRIEKKINKLILSLHDGSYFPTVLNSKNINAVPSFDDNLVQEVLKLLLDAIYGKTISDSVYGLSGDKNYHSALKYVQLKATGTKWWIASSIQNHFERSNNHILLQILSERIKEQKFMTLINKFLKAGYMNFQSPVQSWSGQHKIPIISNVLLNIYFDKFDKFVESMIVSFNKGKMRKPKTQYCTLRARAYRLKKKIKESPKKNQSLSDEYAIAKKNLRQYTMKYGPMDYYDPDFRRLSYVRYKNEVLIGVVSSRNEAVDLMSKFSDFLKTELNLDFADSKIINNRDKVRFLGYDLTVMWSDSRPQINGNVNLLLPYDQMVKFILDNEFGKFECDPKTGKRVLKSKSIPWLSTKDDIAILKYYDQKIKTAYEYFKMASNVSKMYGFYFIVQESFAKTLANKYRTSVAKIYANRKYNHRRKGSTHFGVVYKNKFYELFNGPFTVVKKIKI